MLQQKIIAIAYNWSETICKLWFLLIKSFKLLYTYYNEKLQIKNLISWLILFNDDS